MIFFNAYKNGNLIKKVLIKQFLYQTKLAFAEFQQHILKTYSNLKFCWINEENDLSSSTKVIEFNQEYFALLNKKIDWETFLITTHAILTLQQIVRKENCIMFFMWWH